MEVRPALVVVLLVVTDCWEARSNCDDLGAIGMIAVGGVVDEVLPTNIGDGIGGLTVTFFFFWIRKER